MWPAASRSRSVAVVKMMAAAAANEIPRRAVVEPLRTAQAQRAQHPPVPPVNRATQRWGPDRASTQNLHQVDDEPARVRFLCSQVSASHD